MSRPGRDRVFSAVTYVIDSMLEACDRHDVCIADLVETLRRCLDELEDEQADEAIASDPDRDPQLELRF